MNIYLMLRKKAGILTHLFLRLLASVDPNNAISCNDVLSGTSFQIMIKIDFSGKFLIAFRATILQI